MAPDRKRRGGLPDTGPQGAAGERLDHAILRSEPAFNALEVAAETGVTIEQTRRLWRALGFPEFSGEKAYTAADIEAVSKSTAPESTKVMRVATASTSAAV